VRAVGAVVGLAVALVACGSTVAGSTTTTTGAVVIPVGWRTYTYGRVAVSVPADWAVTTGDRCAVGAASGLLVLGPPGRLSDCPTGVASVVVAPIPAGAATETAACPSIVLHGQRATVVPCHPGAGTSIVQYLLPSLGIEAVGNGTPGEDVSGPGTGTVVGQVLHTLR